MCEEKRKDIKNIVTQYVTDIKQILGEDFQNAVIYGSFARGDMREDSDIDIAVFTNRKPQEFYLLINQIAERTFEYNIKYDIMLAPVFQNTDEYKRMFHVMPYYQSIHREGIVIG